MFTYLIVDIHDRHHACVRPDGVPELLEVHQPIALHWQIGNVPAALLHVAAAVQDALVCRMPGFVSR